MQKKTQPTPAVAKPILTGSWHGRDAVRQGLRMMLNILFVSLIYLVLSLLLSFDSLALRVASCVVLVTAAAAYLYFNGATAGQSDAAFAEIMYQRRTDGKEVSAVDQERCFHPAKGFFVALVGAIPFVLLALVFALLTRPETYQLGVLPSWLLPYTRQSGMGDALAYYQAREGVTLLSILRIVVRSMTMPFINVAVKMGDSAALWAERLTPLWVLIAPLGYGLGYRQGLRMRAQINAGILIGDQRKRRKERRERRARAKSSSPQRLV